MRKNLIIKDKEVVVFDKPGIVFGDHSTLTGTKYKRQFLYAATDAKFFEITYEDLQSFMQKMWLSSEFQERT